MPSGPQPFSSASLRISQSVVEPLVETCTVLPFMSSSDLIGESHGTMRQSKSGGPASAATPVIGTPFAAKAKSVPPPR